MIHEVPSVLLSQESQSAYQQIINWLSEHAVELNAIVSLFLTLVIIWIYFRQHRLLRKQTDSMKDQTQAMRAGIKPILRIDDFDYLERHPHENREYPNPDYIDLTLTNVGNETANDLVLLTAILGEINVQDISFPINIEPLKPQSRPIVEREGEGSVLASNDTESFYTRVEIQIDHPDVDESPRPIGNALGTLLQLRDQEDERTRSPVINDLCLAFAIRYENLAGESTVLPIEHGIIVDLEADYSSFKNVLENRRGTCDGTEVFSTWSECESND